MAASVLSQAQFGSANKKVVKDPAGDPKFNKPRFTGANGSKTMHVAGGHVPKPLGIHPHHRKAGRRTRRAR